MRVEQQLVDVVMDKLGEVTLDDICQSGFREELADELAGPIDQLLSEWMRKRQKEILLRQNQQR